jgi:hypothetical protein
MLLWCFYFSGVGLAQAVLYNGRAPRLASVIAGGLLMELTLLPRSMSHESSLVFSAIIRLILGLPAGYLAGTLVGGVFLVADKLRHWAARRIAAWRLSARQIKPPLDS